MDGAISYASGTQAWNGNAPALNARALTIRAPPTEHRRGVQELPCREDAVERSPAPVHADDRADAQNEERRRDRSLHEVLEGRLGSASSQAKAHERVRSDGGDLKQDEHGHEVE